MDTLKVNIKVRYMTLLIGFLATVAVTIWAFFASSSHEPKDIVPVTAAGIAATALVYAAMSLHANQILNEQKLLQEKKQLSLNLIGEWHRPDMAKLTILGAALRKEIKDLRPKEVMDILTNDQEKQMAVVSMLNYMEKMAISVDVGVADEETLREFFGSIVRLNYHALKGFIEHRRTELSDATVFIKYENLARRWGNHGGA
jgi:hypothetical protein